MQKLHLLAVTLAHTATAFSVFAIFVAWAEEVVHEEDEGSDTDEIVDDLFSNWPGSDELVDEVEIEETDESPVEGTNNEERHGDAFDSTFHTERS